MDWAAFHPVLVIALGVAFGPCAGAGAGGGAGDKGGVGAGDTPFAACAAVAAKFLLLAQKADLFLHLFYTISDVFHQYYFILTDRVVDVFSQEITLGQPLAFSAACRNQTVQLFFRLCGVLRYEKPISSSISSEAIYNSLVSYHILT